MNSEVDYWIDNNNNENENNNNNNNLFSQELHMIFSLQTQQIINIHHMIISVTHQAIGIHSQTLSPHGCIFPIGLSTHPGTGVDGASGRGWKLADFLLKHV